MDNIRDHLKMAELKKESLRMLFDQAHAKASSILLFTLQWKDLDDHFELTKNSLLKQAQQLDLKDKNMAETAQVLQQRGEEVETKLKMVKECFDEFQMKEKQLGSIKKSIEECNLELCAKEKSLNSVGKEIEDCDEDHRRKKEQLGFTEKVLEECNKELIAKKEQLVAVQMLMEECNGKLESKTAELGFANVKLEECSKELFVKQQNLDSVLKALHKCSQELETKENEVEKAKLLSFDCHSELKLKEEQLGKIKDSISDCNSELDLKKKKLEVLKERGEKCSVEVEIKAKELVRIDESIERQAKELDLKKKELDTAQVMIKECLKELDLKMGELSSVEKLIGESAKDFDFKEMNLNSIKMLIEENTEELESKEKQHAAISKSIDKLSVELKLKEAHLEGLEKSISECSSKLQHKEKKLDSVQKYLKRYSQELYSKKEKLKSIKKGIDAFSDDLELKEREFNAIRKSIRERDEELKLKNEQLKSAQLSITVCGEERKNVVQQSVVESSEVLESKRLNLDAAGQSSKLELEQAELDSVQKSTSESGKDIDEKEKHAGSVGRTLEESSKKLEITVTQFEERVKEFELEKQQFDSMKQSVEERWKQVDLKEKQLNENVQSQEKVVKPENLMDNHCLFSAGFKRCISSNRQILQLLLNEHFRIHDLVHGEVFNAVEKSPNLCKLVLDALQGFYPSALNKLGMEDLNVIRRSCITLLEQLLKISPQIDQEFREEAIKLAREWKGRMGASKENSVEVLGFLHLVAAFKLASAFSLDELRSLLAVVSEHRQALELQRALEIAENLPRRNVVPSHVKIERLENLDTSDPICSPSENFQSLQEDMGMHDLNDQEVLHVLKLSLDPAKFVLDRIRELCSQHNNAGIRPDTSIDRNKVLMLEQLMKVSPIISPQVKQESRMLAISWKTSAALDTQNKMDVWAFLLFVAIYGLVSYFQSDEILLLVGAVANLKQVPEICQILGLADMIPRLIEMLLYKQQYIEAARFSCAFELTHIFPLESVLLKYKLNATKNAWSSTNVKQFLHIQNEAIGKEIGALKAILEVITDYKLESRFASWNIPGRIVELEKLKSSGKRSLATRADTDQPELQGRNHCFIGISGLKHPPPPAPMMQPSQLYNQNLRNGFELQPNIKRHRTNINP